MEKTKCAPGNIWPESDPRFHTLSQTPADERDWGSLDIVYWLNASPHEASAKDAYTPPVRRTY